jgi:hypothetical protein
VKKTFAAARTVFWLALRRKLWDGIPHAFIRGGGICMTKSLVLGTLLLGGCFAVFAQQNSTVPEQKTRDQQTVEQNSQGSATPSSSTQDQTSGTSSADSSAIAAGNTTAHGCLSQGSNGQFMLADSASGKYFTLSGDTSQLSSNVGNEVRVEGTEVSNTPDPNAMAQPSGSTSAPSIAIAVSRVHKISSTCPAGNGPNAPSNKGS